MNMRLALLWLVCAVLGRWPRHHPPEPPGYRMDDYRAPTPATLLGATGVDHRSGSCLVGQARRRHFIDVLPRPPRPAGLPASTIWHPKPRSDIPGSIWLPDTGYGALAPVMEDIFRSVDWSGHRPATRDRMLVFYCQRDCWMSWNAAKRAMTLGYTHVGWYPRRARMAGNAWLPDWSRVSPSRGLWPSE